MEATAAINPIITHQKGETKTKNSLFEKIARIIKIIFCEGWATLRYAIPYSLKWGWRRHIARTIKTESFSGCSSDKKVTRVAFFNIHGKVDKEASSILFCHGDYGHPFTGLHLLDIAKSEKKNVFSLYIPNVSKNKDFEVHDDLLRQSIEKINKLAPGAILGVGHSKGAILLAHRQFVQLDPYLTGVCAIAGRLRIPKVEAGKAVDPRDKVDACLEGILSPIDEGIVEHQERLLTQIVPRDDWNASQEGMMVRKGSTCRSVPGMHFSGLYAKETKEFCKTFIEQVS
jgi:hypothetical protein